MLIATKAWSDFASTIPLIRSFSFGNNFPPQYPIFPGLPIHYHFLFYLMVGFLEKLGLRINLALNILSILGFFGLLLIVYYFAKNIFVSRSVGILTVILFLFNGSLSFVYFFKNHPLSKNIIYEIFSNQKFSSFGPYDNGIVSAFWNLNIYTNQRHLAPAFAISLLIIFLFINPVLKRENPSLKLSILLGIILGFYFYFHLAVFLMTVVILIILALLFPKVIKSLLLILSIGAVIALPQYKYLESGGSTFKPFFSPGYLASFNLTIISFVNYWIQNLGLHIILIPLGFIFAPKNAKKILIAFFSLFIIGNTMQFSPEMAANHKFFNYFMIIGVMFSSYSLVKLWNKKNLLKPIAVILFFFLILSGIIDFFPVYNDSKIALPDYPINQDVKWIMQNTPPSSVFLNIQYLYTPASLAGRKIFLGWPYFPWSAGYDTLTRDNLRKNLLNSNNVDLFCKKISRYNINYVEINLPSDSTDFSINRPFFEENFDKMYKNNQGQYIIYSIKKRCINIRL
ncbi:MAG: hypothetical protein M1372_00230 [Patescibacteria group bacterium]|nr:hypothetical protein [Patescibacteria group bacterium]